MWLLMRRNACVMGDMNAKFIGEGYADSIFVYGSCDWTA